VRRLVLLQAMMRTGRHRREHLFSLTPPLAWRKYSRSRMGSAADTRQSRRRLLDPILSLPVSAAERLGRGWRRESHVDKDSCCRVKCPVIIDRCRGQIACSDVYILCCSHHGRDICRSLSAPRGDLVKLTVRQLYGIFSTRRADRRQQRSCGQETNTSNRHHTPLHNKR
jgi:hypothetical protein